MAEVRALCRQSSSAHHQGEQHFLAWAKMGKKISNANLGSTSNYFLETNPSPTPQSTTRRVRAPVLMKSFLLKECRWALSGGQSVNIMQSTNASAAAYVGGGRDQPGEGCRAQGMLLYQTLSKMAESHVGVQTASEFSPSSYSSVTAGSGGRWSRPCTARWKKSCFS